MTACSDDGIVVVEMFQKPSKALMIALRDFVFRHDIFVEAREFEDGLIFVRRPKGRSKRLGPRRHFKVSLRRNRRRVHFYTVTCGSNDIERHQVPIDFPEEALLRPAEAAIEYEECRRDVNRYVTRFPKDTEIGGAVRVCAIGITSTRKSSRREKEYGALLRLVRRHRRQPRLRRTTRSVKTRRPGARP